MLYLPGAKWRPISYRLEAGKFTAPPLGYIVHVPVSNGSLYSYFNGLTSPNRKFCHAWVAKDGTSEQYQSLDYKSWAQGAGNGTYWSFEIEGFPTEPMTDAQLDVLAGWHRFLGVDDHVATAPGQTGIGTHQMGGAAWGGHSCPGTIRTAQLPDIITRANTPQEEPLTQDDKDWIESRLLAHRNWALDNLKATMGRDLASDIAALPTVDDIAAAVVAKLPAGTVDADAVATAVRDRLADGQTTFILGKA